MSADRALTELRAAESRWNSALRQHRLAPPDDGFSRRLRDFADACEQQQAAYSSAAQAGLGWDPLPPASARRPPHELLPDSGRRGPAELWAQFDDTIDQLNAALQGVSLQAIARVFGELSEIARQLSVAVAGEDATTPGRARRAL
jgi:hypothetical protein